MKIRLIDFGVPENRRPFRAHDNDAGADVFMPYDCTIKPGDIAKIPLGFGIEVPDGYVAFVFPRTSMAVKGLVCELPPVDSGYRGEIHAIISNVGDKKRRENRSVDYYPCYHIRLCFQPRRTARHGRLWQHGRMRG